MQIAGLFAGPGAFIPSATPPRRSGITALDIPKASRRNTMVRWHSFIITRFARIPALSV